MRPARIVVMGVSGCGKSTVGRLLATACGVPYVEGDDLHSPENVERMRSGIALTDAQRSDWLERIAQRLAQADARSAGVVVSCSALKRSYRDVLRRAAPDLRLVHLHGAPALLAQRIAQRVGHYMPVSLQGSQLATLEPPGPDENAMAFDIAEPPEAVVGRVLARLQLDTGAGDRAGGDLQEMHVTAFTRTILFTDADGRARFRDESIALDQGTPQSMLSALFASGGYQLRHSPVGFRSQFHCTPKPQWVFILGGQMEIGLQGGVSRVFSPGDHFYSADVLPEGASFDATIHGHWSRQVGTDPLVTLFLQG